MKVKKLGYLLELKFDFMVIFFHLAKRGREGVGWRGATIATKMFFCIKEMS